MMRDFPTKAQIVIIGGGVMGASTAYHLAVRGVKDIVLLEKQSLFGMGATGKCAGGVRYQFSTEINIRLSQHSLPMLDRFPDEIGQEIDRRKTGYLFLLTRQANVERFKEIVALQHRLGVQTEWLTGDEVRRRVPQLKTDDVLAGTNHPEDGLADPNSVVNGYITAARRLGVQSFTDSPVRAIDLVKRGFSVQTPHGAIACEKIVNAAGPWSSPVSEMVGVPLPVKPVRQQMLTTSPLPQIQPDFPFVIDFAQSLYFHREGEGLLTGMTNPNQPAGFDESVDEEWEFTHLEAAIARLPLLETAGLQSHWAGLYEVTPDAHPIISAIAEQPGYYVVTGFSGHGFMHGPIAGLLLTEIILDGQAHTLNISRLAYDRFSEEELTKEYNVI
ncbi:MAG TPA: FAD-binding oxidoreductase [Anaerolineae bacterium]|nr:FAD-binding oxidoreductase [Anaerolineae bacterium]